MFDRATKQGASCCSHTLAIIQVELFSCKFFIRPRVPVSGHANEDDEQVV